MPNPLDKLLDLPQAALGVRASRQQTLAANIANADTPHYKARDVDFRGALEAAMGGRLGGPVELARTSARHIEAKGDASMDASLKYRTETQSSLDGNTVDMDVERAAFAENTVQYEALLTFINGRLRTMQNAIQGQ
ncbi:MAG: flagellar basal body rod protein FlgB [Methyloversatilis sp.]|jgi:flagellar basal-body rod protein FlgB|uniref:flagellar basal body rod protein FlgB n=1 Tax=Methyloversatilis sp. TaxID=2569862 RepID=UPI0027366529|nr:flagellar basal body rod protein FlgB [Methyloversatilis sp.]MDP3290322.1 flagellar basal body rod protein FlgB [Methyloversatilis sp.]MDP3871386.1 flagellar basal body rod protein FlgB [Methyloversatilis sp.]